MTYKTELINKIKSYDNWPKFERADFLDELDAIGHDVYEKKSVEGYLASVLIFQQLGEEIVKQLIKEAQFFIQLSVFPAEIQFLNKEKLTFGLLIDELKNTISFPHKDEIIESCHNLNKYRNDFIHKLTKRPSVIDIGKQVSEFRGLYIKIYELFIKSHEHFTLSFKGFKKDIDWDEHLKEE